MMVTFYRQGLGGSALSPGPSHRSHRTGSFPASGGPVKDPIRGDGPPLMYPRPELGCGGKLRSEVHHVARSVSHLSGAEMKM